MVNPDHRQVAIGAWLHAVSGGEVKNLRPASSDASFRRYFRFDLKDRSWIAMDAPPPQENVAPFIKISELLHLHGLQVPVVQAADVARGFLWLDDLGSADYLSNLSDATVDDLYRDALSALIKIQTIPRSDQIDLPTYDQPLLTRELNVFREWFLKGLLALEETDREERLLSEVWRLLVESALSQPMVMVHRDFHSRNLMKTDHANPGILDFQDAVRGPITYDLVSLLRDCYVDWSDVQVESFMGNYWETLVTKGMLSESLETFRKWFDLMGLQRHLKAIGIFSRLKMRDQKPGYLKDIPRTMGYVLYISERYPEFQAWREYLEDTVLPRYQKVMGSRP
jgi:aminoglycoside/choline kinase family phosphotransferase